MKLKIASIEKTYEPFKMNNGGNLYAYGVKLIDGTWAKIVTYTDKLAITAGLELSVGDNCENIKEEIKKYTGKDGQENSYKQYTVYAKKKEYGFKRGGEFKKISPQTMKKFIDLSYDEARSLAGDNPELVQGYFQTLINNYCDHVEIEEQKEEKKLDTPVAVFENPYADDIPF